MLKRACFGLMLLFLLSVSLSGIQAQAQDEALALQVIAQINAWRISEGMWPLKPNDTLEAMAIDQAAYLVSLPDLPDDFHAGPTGLQPRARALRSPYNWPHYALETQIAIGENAGVGTIASAMRFWRSSTLHTNTILNDDYREIGVAALPYNDEHVFIVVFGSRPDVLPALVNPADETTIYLSNEAFAYASFYDSIQAVTELTLFDADGRPLSDEPVDWAETITVPAAAGDEVFILASDGEHQVLSAVDLDADRAIVPGHIPVLVADAVTGAQPQAVITATVEAIKPTSLPLEPTVVATEVQPTAVPTQAEPTAVPTVMAPEPDLLILYTRDTLDVLNVSGVEVDWSALSFEGAISFPFTQWARVTEIPVNAMPANHCTQIRSGALTGAVVVAEGCRWVRSLIQINPDRLFWTQSPFDVRLNDSTLVTCQPGAGVCSVSLP